MKDLELIKGKEIVKNSTAKMAQSRVPGIAITLVTDEGQPRFLFGYVGMSPDEAIFFLEETKQQLAMSLAHDGGKESQKNAEKI